MKIDLCKLFGVEEGEEFRIKHKNCVRFIYKIVGDSLMFRGKEEKDFWFSDLSVNVLLEIESIIKLPKKKEFTDDELCILRNINKEFKWLCRDRDGVLSLYMDKPKKYKVGGYWDDNNSCILDIEQIIPHLFQSIQWEDEEPVFIDDYAER